MWPHTHTHYTDKTQMAHGGGRVVNASGSETPASAIIYDAYTSVKTVPLSAVVLLSIVLSGLDCIFY